jgi:hypothetical protein
MLPQVAYSFESAATLQAIKQCLAAYRKLVALQAVRDFLRVSLWGNDLEIATPIPDVVGEEARGIVALRLRAVVSAVS